MDEIVHLKGKILLWTNNDDGNAKDYVHNNTIPNSSHNSGTTQYIEQGSWSSSGNSLLKVILEKKKKPNELYSEGEAGVIHGLARYGNPWLHIQEEAISTFHNSILASSIQKYDTNVTNSDIACQDSLGLAYLIGKEEK